MTTQEKVIGMKNEIVQSAIKYGLNLTIYEGNIAFVDQREGKIVAVWKPQYTCVCCGETIPEGRQVCRICEHDFATYTDRIGAKIMRFKKFVPKDGVQLTIDDVEEKI